MQLTTEKLKLFAKEFNIPIIYKNSHIWFIRTQSGNYFNDFYYNEFVALGWDLISKELIDDNYLTDEAKKEKISELYPDKQKPGLILNQLKKFYNTMKSGDLIIIPSKAGKEIAVGYLGDIATNITHFNITEDDEQCNYKHTRTVKWIKRIDLSTDIYLSKIIYAQQAVTDLSPYSDYIYRNIHPCYLNEDGLHLMFQKTDNNKFRLKDNIAIQRSIINIYEELSEYLDVETKDSDLVIKTAVGSPGFIELLSFLPTGAVTFVFVFMFMLGGIETKEGEKLKGIMGFLELINKFFNDSEQRSNTAADTELKKALARKTNAEAETIELNNQQIKMLQTAQKLEVYTNDLAVATKESNISIDKPI